MTRSWFLRRALLALSLSGAVSACAAIWGFQDAIDSSDGGPDASMDASGPGNGDSGALDSTVADAGDALAAIVDAPNDASEDASQPVLCQACAPPVPPGWSGPLELFQLDALLAADGAAPPSCGQADSGWAAALDLHALPDAAPASCICSCGLPSGSLCSAVANYFSDPNCKTSCGTTLAIDAGCTTLAPADPQCIRAELAATLEDAGTCGPSRSMNVPAVSWEVTARLCSPSTTNTSASNAAGGICEAGVCVPATESGFESGVYCAIYADIVDCPDVGYPVRHGYNDAGSSYYADAGDTRGCSSCGCSSPANVVCVLEGGTTTMTSPAGACIEPSSAGACANISMGPMTIFATATATPAGGACTTLPEGGEPTGTLVPTAPYTICCTQ